MKIGVLIPEFPGQTHILFWRELRALARHGIDAEVVSTRRPPPGVVSHSWSNEAMQSTWYLSPLGPRQVAAAARAGACAPPASWASCIASWARARGLGLAGRARLLGLVAIGAELAGLAHARGWSHVHCHSCADSAHVALFARLLGGPPYSMTLHGPLADYGPNQREKWRHAAFGLVVTRRLLAEVQQELAGALPPIVDVAPMGVDLTRFQRLEAYAPWSGGPLRVFTCGRLHPGKGHADLVRAISILRARGLDVHLVVGGEDDAGGSGYRLVLESIVAEARLGGVVTFLGAINEERVVQELTSAHVFALASHAEALGVATMEAMSMCVPVVVTRVGGVPELVEDGVDGLLVPARDPAAIAGRIELLALDPGRALAIANAGRRKVESCFGSDRGAAVLARCIAAGADASRAPATTGGSSPTDAQGKLATSESDSAQP